jgi:hypothetical protein
VEEINDDIVFEKRGLSTLVLVIQNYLWKQDPDWYFFKSLPLYYLIIYFQKLM